MRYLKEVLGARELLVNLTLREVRGKYKRTVFGQLWSLVNPLILMVIYTFIFGFIFRLQPDPGNPSGRDVFALWLLCGLLPWTFFSSLINQAMGSIVWNANLIQKVHFTRIVLPLSIVGSVGFSWLFEMGVLVVALAITNYVVLLWLPGVLLAMVLLALFGTGVALMLAIANVHFRDTEYLTSLLLQFWMYLTPIIYPVNLVAQQSAAIGGLLGTPVTLLDIYRLNPMFHFVDLFRQLLYDNRWPDVPTVLICTAWALIVFALGVIVFHRNEKKLAEIL